MSVVFPQQKNWQQLEIRTQLFPVNIQTFFALSACSYDHSHRRFWRQIVKCQNQ